MFLNVVEPVSVNKPEVTAESDSEKDDDDLDINRTKVKDGSNNPDNELEIPGKPGKVNSKYISSDNID